MTLRRRVDDADGAQESPVDPASEEPMFATSLEQVASALSPLRASSSPAGLAHAVTRLVTSAVAAACRVDVVESGASGAPAALAPLARSVRPGRSELADPAMDIGDEEVLAGIAVVIEDASRDLSWVVIPLVAHHRTIGSIRVVLDGTSAPGAAALAFLHHIASSLALGLSAAELHAQAERVSRRLQESLLPYALPEGEWFEVAARYVPATAGMHVGGDWYDAQLIGRAELAFSVGDVAGHGVEAAARMGELRSAMTALRLLSRAPDDLIGLLHRICDPAGYFATALCARVEPSGGFRWASAGHLPPIVLRGEGTVELVAGRQSPPLGTGTEGTVMLNEFPISPGDTVLLYTDGLVERRDEPLDASLDRLLSHIAAATRRAPEELLGAILDAREESGPTGDDIAMVAVQLLPRADAGAP